LSRFYVFAKTSLAVISVFQLIWNMNPKGKCAVLKELNTIFANKFVTNLAVEGSSGPATGNTVVLFHGFLGVPRVRWSMQLFV
jgi:hypothetical protein